MIRDLSLSCPNMFDAGLVGQKGSSANLLILPDPSPRQLPSRELLRGDTTDQGATIKLCSFLCTKEKTTSRHERLA